MALLPTHTAQQPLFGRAGSGYFAVTLVRETASAVSVSVSVSVTGAKAPPVAEEAPFQPFQCPIGLFLAHVPVLNRLLDGLLFGLDMSDGLGLVKRLQLDALVFGDLGYALSRV